MYNSINRVDDLYIHMYAHKIEQNIHSHPRRIT